MTSVGLESSGFRLRGLLRLAKQTRENLPRGIFAETNRRVEIFLFRKAVVREQLVPIRFGNFLQAAAEVAGIFLQKLLPHFRGFFALVQVDPLADLAAGVRRLDEAEPVAAGRVAFVGENFDHVAADDLMAQRNHLAVHFCAHALVADFGVHGISKVDWRGAAGQLQNPAFGREGVNFDRRQIHFQAWTEIRPAPAALATTQ